MNAIFIVMRRMRAPLIVLIAIYAISVLGLTLVPGVDAAGRPWRMGFFHAFYFMSYTATTIGFGEIPYAFSDAQRLWVIVSIYLTVIGWAYAIGSLLALIQDRGFQQAIAAQRFGRAVRRLREPFYLICGYGETGQLLARSLDRLGLRFVVLDKDERRIQALELQDFHADAASMTADAREPKKLLAAGLTHRMCRGVMALTDDEKSNLAVAISARLLKPDLPAICRVHSPEVAANMASFGTQYIIDSFEKFGEYLALAVRSPGSYQLLEWLTGVPGTELVAQREPPRGRWILCGYGRFGRAVARNIVREGITLTIVDPAVQPDPARGILRGTATEAPMLREAGVMDAAGIIAGSDDDVNNLSIVMTARELNPELFVVLRQNLQANRPLFGAFRADFVMVPSEIIAHECLALLTTPLLSRFLAIVKQRDDAWADALVARLQASFGKRVPAIWDVTLDFAGAPALHPLLVGGRAPTLAALLRDPSRREDRLPCVVLMAIRDGEVIELPGDELALQAGDRLLCAGLARARALQQLGLRNAKALDYVLTGRNVPDGWLWRRFAAADEKSAP
jgi:Trk K+ transport system NAD-binding subunit